MTFANEDDVISFRHHVYSVQGKEASLSEIGPRFEMQLYQLRLGTLDQVGGSYYAQRVVFII